jgi:hypothetical protein
MDHECKRFKTVQKRNGVREIVECRKCGKRKDVKPVVPEAEPVVTEESK